MARLGSGGAVFKEFPKVRHIPGKGHRRWFSDTELDLIVWYADETRDEIRGFQLYCGPTVERRAVTWLEGAGFSHDRIDDGEQTVFRNRTPILVADGTFPRVAALELFTSGSGELERSLASYLRTTLEHYPR